MDHQSEDDESLLAAIEKELESGDFVTLSRVNKGFLTQETLLTFSNIEIQYTVPTYACYASPEWESQEDSQSSFET
jgi:hypothetical protein